MWLLIAAIISPGSRVYSSLSTPGARKGRSSLELSLELPLDLDSSPVRTPFCFVRARVGDRRSACGVGIDTFGIASGISSGISSGTRV